LGVQLPRHFGGFIEARQQRLVDLQQLQQLVGPRAVRHVEQQHAAGVAHFRRVLAGHAEADVILGQEDVLRLLVDLRLVLAHPQDLGSGEPGEGGVRHQLDQRLAPAGLEFDLGALLGRPLVVPQQGRAERFSPVA
jgi:hypothetical protein